MCACNCDKGMVEDAMKAEAMGMDVRDDYNESPMRATPPNRLDLMKEDYNTKINEARRHFEEFAKMQHNNQGDIWSRLDRIESILGLPPIADEQGPRPGW